MCRVGEIEGEEVERFERREGEVVRGDGWIRWEMRGGADGRVMERRER